MTIHTNGRINVTTPGTPVRLSNDPAVVAHKLFFQVIPGLTGKTYIGVPAMSKETFSGVARVLMPNSNGDFSETFCIEAQQDENTIHLSEYEYAIDADVAGEGLLVTYWIA